MFYVAIWPADLDVFKLILRAEAEVQAQVAGGVVTGAAAHLIDPQAPCSLKGYACAYGIAVRGSSDKMETKPVILVLCQIDEEHRAVAEIVDDCFDPSIIEEIGDGEASAGAGFGEAGTGSLADVFELAVAEIVIEESRLAVEGAEFGGVDLWIDMAVDHEKVRPAIVIDIGKHGAPAEGVGVDAEAGGEGHVGVGAVAVVPVESRCVVGEVGFEEVEFAVTIIIG